MDTKAEDRRKEYELLRNELRSADLSCQVIIATLATITGAIFLNWDSERWYAGIIIQAIWLFGIMYFAERRFTIARIAKYIRENIENGNAGFAYETVMDSWSKSQKKRPPSLPTPLYREIFVGIFVSLLTPFISKDMLHPAYQNILLFISILISIGTAVIGFKICLDYKKFKKQ